MIGGLGRPPWTNLYESLVFFSWGVVAMQVYAQRKWKLPILGAFSMPLVFILMGMSVMTPNKQVEPLVPALQSYWLKIHVVFGMTSYAGFTVAACLAYLQLIRNRVSLSKLGAGLAIIAVINLSLVGGPDFFKTGKFMMAKTTERALPDGTEVKVKDTYQEFPGGPMIVRMEEVPLAHIPYAASIVFFLAAAVALWVNGRGKRGYDLKGPSLGLFTLGVFAMLGLFAAIAAGLRTSSTLTLYSNPYLIILLFGSLFFSAFYLALVKRYEVFVAGLPEASRLDELSYKSILFAFPFQTLLLITGAIWAYYAWGRSWGWDPKETWAFITWLCFLIYLHGKLLMHWKSNLLSVLAIVGFVIMVFAFLGVNLVLSGLHSYGSA